MQVSPEQAQQLLLQQQQARQQPVMQAPPQHQTAHAPPANEVPAVVHVDPGDRARRRAAAAHARFRGWSDRSQLSPLTAAVAFDIVEGKIKANSRKAFVDSEGAESASGVPQDEANSTFGGARTSDVEWTLDRMAVAVYADTVLPLQTHEELRFRMKTAVSLKISESINKLGNLYLFGAGGRDYASMDYGAVYQFKEPIPLQKQKHFSAELKLTEDVELSRIESGRVVCQVIFLGTRDIDPADKASI